MYARAGSLPKRSGGAATTGQGAWWVARARVTSEARVGGARSLGEAHAGTMSAAIAAGAARRGAEKRKEMAAERKAEEKCVADAAKALKKLKAASTLHELSDALRRGIRLKSYLPELKKAIPEAEKRLKEMTANAEKGDIDEFMARVEAAAKRDGAGASPMDALAGYFKDLVSSTHAHTHTHASDGAHTHMAALCGWCCPTLSSPILTRTATAASTLRSSSRLWRSSRRASARQNSRVRSAQLTLMVPVVWTRMNS